MTQRLAATNLRTLRTFLLMRQFAGAEIGARIQEARKVAGLTQEQLADLLGLSKRSLQDYESGTTIPFKHLFAIGKVTQRPPDWFLHGDEDRPGEDREELMQDLRDVADRLTAAAGGLEATLRGLEGALRDIAPPRGDPPPR